MSRMTDLHADPDAGWGAVLRIGAVAFALALSGGFALAQTGGSAGGAAGMPSGGGMGGGGMGGGALGGGGFGGGAGGRGYGGGMAAPRAAAPAPGGFGSGMGRAPVAPSPGYAAPNYSGGRAPWVAPNAPLQPGLTPRPPRPGAGYAWRHRHRHWRPYYGAGFAAPYYFGGYPYDYGYGYGYGYDEVYGYPAEPGGYGQYCVTRVKTCRLIEPSIVGTGCSCRVTGGRARGVVR